MSEIKENQKRISIAGKQIYVLSWVSFTTSLLWICRSIFFLALSQSSAQKCITVLSVILFAFNFAFACGLFSLARQSKAFIFSGVFLILASAADLLTWSSTSNTGIFIIFYPVFILLMPVFIILLSKGMLKIVDYIKGNSYDQWTRYRNALVFLYVARILCFVVVLAQLASHFLEVTLACFAVLTLICNLLAFWQFFLLRDTAKQLKDYSKLTIE